MKRASPRRTAGALLLLGLVAAPGCSASDSGSALGGGGTGGVGGADAAAGSGAGGTLGGLGGTGALGASGGAGGGAGAGDATSGDCEYPADPAKSAVCITLSPELIEIGRASCRERV